MLNRTIVGIDPGRKGGLAFISFAGDILLVERMPRHVDSIINLLAQAIEPRVYIERARFIPIPGKNQGGKFIFNYGREYGRLLGVFDTLKVPYREIESRTWQKGLGVKRNEDETTKEAALKHLLKIWPASKSYLSPGRCRSPQDGLVDALLIGEFGRRQELVDTKLAS